MTDNFHLEVDPGQIQLWELAILEDNPKINDLIFIFAKYLHNGKGPVSPELPTDPIDELTPEQLATYKVSSAYKAMRRFPLDQMKNASMAFLNQASEKLDPK